MGQGTSETSKSGLEANPGKPVKNAKQTNPKITKILGSAWYSYVFLSVVLMYLLLCGFVVVFAGDWFVEGILRKGFMPDSADYDKNTFLMGYLWGFAGMLGIFGGISVLTTRPRDYSKLKVLFFLPSVFWSLMLVFDAFRWRGEYLSQFLYLIPALLASIFLAYSVHKKVAIPLYRE